MVSYLSFNAYSSLYDGLVCGQFEDSELSLYSYRIRLC